MKCPKCNKKMRSGSVMSPRGIYWDNEKKGRWSVLGTETLISMWSWKIGEADAWRCDACRLIVFQIPEK